MGGRVDVGEIFSVGDKGVCCGPVAIACRVEATLVSNGRALAKERLLGSGLAPHACDPSKSIPEPDFLSTSGCLTVPWDPSRSFAASDLASLLGKLLKAHMFFSPHDVVRDVVDATFLFVSEEKLALGTLVKERDWMQMSANA